MKASKKEVCDKLLLAAQGDERLRKFVVVVVSELNDPMVMAPDPLPIARLTVHAFSLLGCLRVNDVVDRYSRLTGEDFREITECSKEFYQELWAKFAQIFQATFPEETEELERMIKISKSI